MKYVLVILLIGAGDGGRAINTDITFSSAKACEAAAEIVRNATGRVNSFWSAHAVCVEQR